MSEFKLTPKSPDHIKSQIAAFAHEGLELHYEREDVLENLGELAAQVFDPSNPYDREYRDYLRSVRGSRHEMIQGRVEILSNYSEFAPSVKQLRHECSELSDSTSHPTFLGSGTNSDVFSIIHQDKVYAVRVPKEERDLKEVDYHLTGAVRGKGIPHLEQIVAASYEDGITVAEMMPGNELGDLSVQNEEHITDSQLRELLGTLISAQRNEVRIELTRSNVLYDTEAGFGIVDYVAGKQYLGETAGAMAAIFREMGMDKYRKISSTDPELHYMLEHYRINLAVIKRYRAIANSMLDGNVKESALRSIDLEIENTEELIKNV